MTHVEAGGVWLVEELARVADTFESLDHQLGMVQLLETDHIRIMSDDLLQHPPSPDTPVKCILMTPDKVVILGAEGLGQHIPLHHPEWLPEQEGGLELGEVPGEGRGPAPEVMVTQRQQRVSGGLSRELEVIITICWLVQIRAHLYPGDIYGSN